MSDIEFVDGLSVKEPREGAPDFVKGSISINRKSLGNWLRGKTDEWINIDIKVSKGGKWYTSVNNWKPDSNHQPSQQSQQPETQAQSSQPVNNDFDQDIPF